MKSRFHMFIVCDIHQGDFIPHVKPDLINCVYS